MLRMRAISMERLCYITVWRLLCVNRLRCFTADRAELPSISKTFSNFSQLKCHQHNCSARGEGDDERRGKFFVLHNSHFPSRPRHRRFGEANIMSLRLSQRSSCSRLFSSTGCCFDEENCFRLELLSWCGRMRHMEEI